MPLRALLFWALVYSYCGLCACLELLKLLWSIGRRPGKTFQWVTRENPPACLNDPSLGTHCYVRIKVRARGRSGCWRGPPPARMTCHVRLRRGSPSRAGRRRCLARPWGPGGHPHPAEVTGSLPASLPRPAPCASQRWGLRAAIHFETLTVSPSSFPSPPPLAAGPGLCCARHAGSLRVTFVLRASASTLAASAPLRPGMA